MYYSSKFSLKVKLFLVIIIFLSSNNFTSASVFKKNTLTNSNPISIDFPILPKRPSFKDLYHSLGVPDIEQQSVLNSEKVKNELIISPKVPEASLDNGLNNIFDRNFNVNSDKLFSESLNAVKSLNLLLKYLDIGEKKIVAIDKNRNTILISILPNDKLSSNIKIAGYSTVEGKDSLAKSAKQLISLISEKTK